MRLISLLLVAALIFPLSACWDRREPEEMAFVIAVGFDYNEELQMYKIIAQIANPLGLGNVDGGQGGGSATPFWTQAALGHTPTEAARNLAKESTREIFWSHVGVLLFSEKLARRGIAPVLEFFERGRQMRTIPQPAVVEGDLETLLNAHFPLEETGGRGMARQIVTTMFERALFPSKTLRELYITAAQPGKELFLGRIFVTAGSSESDGPPADNPAQIRGGTVFRGDVMVGWLDERPTTGWHWVASRVFRAIQVLQLPASNDKYVTVEILEAQSHCKPVKGSGEIRIHLHVSVDGRIDDSTGPLKLEPEILTSLERRLAESVRGDIEKALAEAQRLNSDIFGFGNLIYRKMPREWRQIEERWDQLFPRLIVDIDVEAHMRRSGLTDDSLEFR